MIRFTLLSSLLPMAVLFITSTAHSLDFRVDFRQSTYQVGAHDTFTSLLTQHERGALIQSNVTQTLEDISTGAHGGDVNSNYSILLMTDVTIGVDGRYTFQVGTDWGRGGAAAMIDRATGSVLFERVIADDIWWELDWESSDVFQTSFVLEEGTSYTLAWVGFEGCCGGSTTLRFSVDDSEFTPLSSSNLESYMATPEPAIAALLFLGLGGLAATRPRT